MTIRNEVLETIIDVLNDAEKRGINAFDAARAAFPGIPDGVLWEAEIERVDRTNEAWWQTVERTIDAEIIKNALRSSQPHEVESAPEPSRPTPPWSLDDDIQF